MEAHQFCTKQIAASFGTPLSRIFLMVEGFWAQSKWLGETQVHRQEEGEGVHVGESESFRPSLLRGGIDPERARSERKRGIDCCG